MNVELDIEDLINLICGSCLSYKGMEDPDIKPYGQYTGGFKDEWNWNKMELSSLDENSLYSLYIKVKKSNYFDPSVPYVY